MTHLGHTTSPKVPLFESRQATTRVSVVMSLLSRMNPPPHLKKLSKKVVEK
jgi:hypothetical protein